MKRAKYGNKKCQYNDIVFDSKHEMQRYRDLYLLQKAGDYGTEAIAESTTAYTIEVTGLRGGHSGDDIHKGFGNANKILNRILWLAQKQFEIGRHV